MPEFLIGLRQIHQFDTPGRTSASIRQGCWLENVRFSTSLFASSGISLKLPMLWWICLMEGHGGFWQKAVVSCHSDQLKLALQPPRLLFLSFHCSPLLSCGRYVIQGLWHLFTEGCIRTWWLQVFPLSHPFLCGDDYCCGGLTVVATLKALWKCSDGLSALARIWKNVGILLSCMSPFYRLGFSTGGCNCLLAGCFPLCQAT